MFELIENYWLFIGAAYIALIAFGFWCLWTVWRSLNANDDDGDVQDQIDRGIG